MRRVGHLFKSLALLFSNGHDAISSLCHRARAKLIVYQISKTPAVKRRFEEFQERSAAGSSKSYSSSRREDTFPEGSKLNKDEIFTDKLVPSCLRRKLRCQRPKSLLPTQTKQWHYDSGYQRIIGTRIIKRKSRHDVLRYVIKIVHIFNISKGQGCALAFRSMATSQNLPRKP